MDHLKSINRKSSTNIFKIMLILELNTMFNHKDITSPLNIHVPIFLFKYHSILFIMAYHLLLICNNKHMFLPNHIYADILDNTLIHPLNKNITPHNNAVIATETNFHL